jgi:Flp pilus assembly protein TadD
LLAIYPHAHYLGKQIEAWADLPDGTRLPLLKIDRWDINWQATYTYKEPILLPAGTTVAMRIGYDNTSGSHRVVTGNRSQDEMGHVWLQVLPTSQTGDDDPRLILQQAVMRRRIEKYPADFEAHFNLGAALQAQGRSGDAVPYLSEAVRIRPGNAMARNNLAVALFAVERFDAAASEFREALALDPGYRNARYNLARTLAAMGDNAAALNELQAQADDAEAQEFAGRLLGRMGQFAKSLPYFRRAAELAPGDATFLINLGAALASSGDPAAAIPVFERALQLDPSNAAAKDNLARARGSLHRP